MSAEAHCPECNIGGVGPSFCCACALDREAAALRAGGMPGRPSTTAAVGHLITAERTRAMGRRKECTEALRRFAHHTATLRLGGELSEALSRAAGAGVFSFVASPDDEQPGPPSPRLLTAVSAVALIAVRPRLVPFLAKDKALVAALGACSRRARSATLRYTAVGAIARMLNDSRGPGGENRAAGRAPGGHARGRGQPPPSLLRAVGDELTSHLEDSLTTLRPMTASQAAAGHRARDHALALIQAACEGSSVDTAVTMVARGAHTWVCSDSAPIEAKALGAWTAMATALAKPNREEGPVAQAARRLGEYVAERVAMVLVMEKTNAEAVSAHNALVLVPEIISLPHGRDALLTAGVVDLLGDGVSRDAAGDARGAMAVARACVFLACVEGQAEGMVGAASAAEVTAIVRAVLTVSRSVLDVGSTAYPSAPESETPLGLSQAACLAASVVAQRGIQACLPTLGEALAQAVSHWSECGLSSASRRRAATEAAILGAGTPPAGWTRVSHSRRLPFARAALRLCSPSRGPSGRRWATIVCNTCRGLPPALISAALLSDNTCVRTSALSALGVLASASTCVCDAGRGPGPAPRSWGHWQVWHAVVEAAAAMVARGQREQDTGQALEALCAAQPCGVPEEVVGQLAHWAAEPRGASGASSSKRGRQGAIGRRCLRRLGRVGTPDASSRALRDAVAIAADAAVDRAAANDIVPTTPWPEKQPGGWALERLPPWIRLDVPRGEGEPAELAPVVMPTIILFARARPWLRLLATRGTYVVDGSLLMVESQRRGARARAAYARAWDYVLSGSTTIAVCVRRDPAGQAVDEAVAEEVGVAALMPPPPWPPAPGPGPRAVATDLLRYAAGSAVGADLWLDLADGGRLPVHRVVMVARSTYFATMLGGGLSAMWAEARTGCVAVSEEVSAGELLVLVRLMYAAVDVDVDDDPSSDPCVRDCRAAAASLAPATLVRLAAVAELWDQMPIARYLAGIAGNAVDRNSVIETLGEALRIGGDAGDLARTGCLHFLVAHFGEVDDSAFWAAAGPDTDAGERLRTEVRALAVHACSTRSARGWGGDDQR